jgi:hypothetical protein
VAKVLIVLTRTRYTFELPVGPSTIQPTKSAMCQVQTSTFAPPGGHARYKYGRTNTPNLPFLVCEVLHTRPRTSRPSQSKRGVERLKLDASVLRRELPIGLGVFLIAIGLPSGDLTLEESLIRHPAIEALG